MDNKNLTRLNRGERGNISISLFFLAAVASTTAVLITVTMMSQRGTNEDIAGAEAMYKAQAALSHALLELNNSVDYDAYGVGTVHKTYANASYYTNYYTDARGVPTILATAVVDVGDNKRITKTIEAKLSTMPEVNLPGFKDNIGATSISGDFRRVKLQFGKMLIDYAGDTIDPLESNNLTIDGHDQSIRNQNVPGIAIQDPDIYTRTMELIGKGIAQGRISADMFNGTPLVHYTAQNGTTFDTSVTQLSEPILSAELYDAIIDSLSKAVTENIIPKATTIISGNIVNIDQNLTLGSGPDSITYIVANDVRINSTVTGTGTLVIQGDVSVNNAGALNWNGTVVTMPELRRKNNNTSPISFTGSNITLVTEQNNQLTVTNNVDGSTIPPLSYNQSKNSKFELRGGDATVSGTMIMLANADAKTVQFQLEHATGTHTHSDHPRASINGSLVLLSESTKTGNAKFVLDEGEVDINGLLSIVGRKTVLEVAPSQHAAGNTSFDVMGAVSISVPSEDQIGDVVLKFKGDTRVRFHSQYVEDAISKLLEFSNLLGSDSPFISNYSILSWREVTSPAVDPSGVVPN